MSLGPSGDFSPPIQPSLPKPNDADKTPSLANADQLNNIQKLSAEALHENNDFSILSKMDITAEKVHEYGDVLCDEAVDKNSAAIGNVSSIEMSGASQKNKFMVFASRTNIEEVKARIDNSLVILQAHELRGPIKDYAIVGVFNKDKEEGGLSLKQEYDDLARVPGISLSFGGRKFGPNDLAGLLGRALTAKESAGLDKSFTALIEKEAREAAKKADEKKDQQAQQQRLDDNVRRDIVRDNVKRAAVHSTVSIIEGCAKQLSSAARFVHEQQLQLVSSLRKHNLKKIYNDKIEQSKLKKEINIKKDENRRDINPHNNDSIA